MLPILSKTLHLNSGSSTRKENNQYTNHTSLPRPVANLRRRKHVTDHIIKVHGGRWLVSDK